MDFRECSSLRVRFFFKDQSLPTNKLTKTLRTVSIRKRLDINRLIIIINYWSVTVL